MCATTKQVLYIDYPLAMTNSLLLKIAIYSGFSHEKWRFSIVFSEGTFCGQVSNSPHHRQRPPRDLLDIQPAKHQLGTNQNQPTIIVKKQLPKMGQLSLSNHVQRPRFGETLTVSEFRSWKMCATGNSCRLPRSRILTKSHCISLESANRVHTEKMHHDLLDVSSPGKVIWPVNRFPKTGPVSISPYCSSGASHGPAYQTSLDHSQTG